MKEITLSVLIGICCLLVTTCAPAQTDFERFVQAFTDGYRALDIPGFTMGYRQYFEAVPQLENVAQQEAFFQQQQRKLHRFNRAGLSQSDQLFYDHLQYEINLNLERVRLEKAWIGAGRPIPANGLHDMPDGKAWYAFFVQKFTSTTMTPEEVFVYGKSEVARVQREIQAIQQQLGFQDSTTFYQHLQSNEFFITDKEEVIETYARIDQQARANLAQIINMKNIPRIEVAEWPGADAQTSPGIYRPGQGAFHFNFYSGKHNRRAMEWLYMHEAIPGHHLQWTARERIEEVADFQRFFFYAGNAEGWGCYVEYLGKNMGFFQDTYAYLGKWEWDLVRSARLVLEVGIHHYGWSKAEAMAYWKANIIGQDDIAEREITRITNWPGQALCYKVGAHYIEKCAELAQANASPSALQAFHQAYLSMSYFPLAVVLDYFRQKTS